MKNLSNEELSEHLTTIKCGLAKDYGDDDAAVRCIEEAARRLAEGGWVSVFERLPEYSLSVLVTDGTWTTAADYYESERRWHTQSGHYLSWNPTHWMPLPAPPVPAEVAE